MMMHALADFPSSYNSIVAAVEDGGSYFNTCRPWSVICDKVYECTEHSANLNPSSAVSGLWSHTTRRMVNISCRNSAGRCLIIIHRIARTSRPVRFSSFLTPQEISVRSTASFSEWQRGWYECHSGSHLSRQTSTTHDTKVGPTMILWSELIKYLPAELLQESCVAMDLTQLMIDLDRRYALYIQKLYHRSHFTVGGCWNKNLHLQLLQRCYCEN